jgi:hypothetical protein
MTEMERALNQAIDDDHSLSQPLRAPPMPQPEHAQGEPVRLRTAKPMTLAEMASTIDRAHIDMAARLRKEGIDAQCLAEERVTAAHAKYARLLSEETARLTRERDDAIRLAEVDYRNKLHELAGLVRQRP